MLAHERARHRRRRLPRTRLVKALLSGPTAAAGRLARHRRRHSRVPDRRPARRVQGRRHRRRRVHPRHRRSGRPIVVFHLAAVLSGQSEAEFDVGLRVNVDATRALLEACPRPGHAAAFRVLEHGRGVRRHRCRTWCPRIRCCGRSRRTAPRRRSPRLLVSEYSRRGFVDGIACRLATVTVRPGEAELGALVVRQRHHPRAARRHRRRLSGAARHAACGSRSPRVVTANLAHAAVVASDALDDRRVVNLPGLCVTPAQMLASLERLGGAAARRACASRSTRTSRALSAHGPVGSTSAGRCRSASRRRATSTRSSPSSWRSRAAFCRRAELQFGRSLPPYSSSGAACSADVTPGGSSRMRMLRK